MCQIILILGFVYIHSIRLITHSDCLKEIDLEHNLIGDLGGRELLEALMDRKEGMSEIQFLIFHINFRTL